MTGNEIIRKQVNIKVRSNKLNQFYKNYLILIKFKNPLDLRLVECYN